MLTDKHLTQLRRDKIGFVFQAFHLIPRLSAADNIGLPMVLAGAEGSYVWDYDGTRYLDLSSQLVNTNIGHQHPKVVAAIQEQAGETRSIDAAYRVQGSRYGFTIGAYDRSVPLVVGGCLPDVMYRKKSTFADVP